MTQAERSYLEERLFLQTNLDAKLSAIVKEVYEQYKRAHKMFPGNHEAKFGMLYCEMIIKGNNQLPNYKSIMNYTKEKQTTYYTYRTNILAHINNCLKEHTLLREPQQGSFMVSSMGSSGNTHILNQISNHTTFAYIVLSDFKIDALLKAYFRRMAQKRPKP